jgi:predicted phage baseplate assembly protein
MMRLPDITLDDRSFQDLVNEARHRIAEACPDWTEHNVSDPGITLIELFAWMTEMVIYRLNRVPDKLHIRLMDLVQLKLEPPTAATTDITFRLAAPPQAEPVIIPGGLTEVATVRAPSEEPIVFQTDEDFTIPAARPTAYLVERGGALRDIGVAEGTANPKGGDQLPFGMPPVPGDALYLGFETSLARLLMLVTVDCAQARGPGVDPEDPPLRWEVSTQEHDGWTEAHVIRDSTGGFNYGSGEVELALPSTHVARAIAGERRFWLRCRIDERTRSGAEGSAFTNPPEIYAITAAPIGASIPAAHSMREAVEELGESDGTPGQRFRLTHAPVLPLAPGETLEVTDPTTGERELWEPRDSFAESGPDDRHFVLDPASGELELGPAVRAGGGRWRRYGAVPPARAALRFTRYRHGGGSRGNVAAGTLTVLRSGIPTVASVTNPRGATGGVDPEPLNSARNRAAMEIRTRHRAVTAEDFEFLCGEASPRVARARCLEPANGSRAVRVHIIPRVEPAERELKLDEITPDETLMREVAAYLDERRMVGTRVELLPARVRGVSVVVSLQASLRADIARVEYDVAHALYVYLNPLVGGSLDGPADGWGFGRTLNVGELYGIVHAVAGVDFVKVLRVYETNLATHEQSSQPAASHILLDPDEVIASARHIVRAEHQAA